MTPLDYEYLRKLLKDRSGLDLSPDKQYLVESRLVPLARKSNLPGIPELVQRIRGGGAEPLTSEVVEAMTTNETFFFRDKIPFDHLREAVLPALIQARAARRSLRIWCAASSTGQEPYSIAICLKEMSAALSGWRTEIVATDLSQAVLEKAKAGIFTQFFCRNVLIYFDQDTKIDIFGRIAKMLEPDGVLVLGAAESVVGITSAFKPYPDRRGLYCLNTAPVARAGATPLALRAVASAAW